MSTPQARAIRNPAAAEAAEMYGDRRSQVLSQPGFDAALREISGWPGYALAPLVRLDRLAGVLGLKSILYKDERGRFGLKSFKALGGAYAVANVLRKKVMQQLGLAGVNSQQLVAGEFAAIARATTVTCATDGTTAARSPGARNSSVAAA